MAARHEQERVLTKKAPSRVSALVFAQDFVSNDEMCGKKKNARAPCFREIHTAGIWGRE